MKTISYFLQKSIFLRIFHLNVLFFLKSYVLVFKSEVQHILKMFLFFGQIWGWCSNKECSYKKKSVLNTHQRWPTQLYGNIFDDFFQRLSKLSSFSVKGCNRTITFATTSHSTTISSSFCSWQMAPLFHMTPFIIHFRCVIKARQWWSNDDVASSPAIDVFAAFCSSALGTAAPRGAISGGAAASDTTFSDAAACGSALLFASGRFAAWECVLLLADTQLWQSVGPSVAPWVCQSEAF